MKALSTLVLLAIVTLVSTESNAKAKNAKSREPFVAQCEAGRLFPGGSIQDAGFRMVYINGQLVKNYTVAFVPTLQPGVILAKLWAPGFDPHDPYVPSDLVRCIDPRPARVEKPYYYPDTY